jgi:hypothetical protein
VIAAAVVCFILFVSAQALRDWPISNLNFGGGNESAAVAPAESLGGSSPNAAAKALEGPVTATPANVGSATKAQAKANAGGTGTSQSAHRHHASGKVSPQTQINGGRGVDSAPSNQPPSTSPAPAPTSGNAPPAGSGTASPAPSGGGSTPAGGNSGGGNSGSGNSGNGNGNGGGAPESTNVGTRTARSVTKAVRDISNAATPPPTPSPVTNTVNAVQEKVAPTPPPSSSTTETVAKAIGNIGK